MKVKAVSVIMLTLLLMSMLTLAFNIQQVESEPRTWTVDDDGPADFSSIQEAINAASQGDTIYVYNGTYYENVVVNKTVSLIGEKRSTTIIDGNGTGSVVYVIANNVNITGFTVQSSSYTDAGIYLDHSCRSTVSNNKIATWGVDIDLFGGSENDLIDNIIGSPYSSYGIHLWNSSDNVISRNLQDSSDVGIGLIGSSHNVISRNKLVFNMMNGMALHGGSDNNFITKNTIEQNLGGLWLDKSNGNTIYQNNFNNMEIQISLEDSTNNTISGNNITANNGFGIGLWESSNYNTVSENSITNNEYGIYLDESSNNKIYHNNFINNTNQAYVHYSSNNVWDDGYPSGGNYWSDHTDVDQYRGPHQNETGSDGIWDHPHFIDEYNQDNYPLTKPYGGTHDIGITNVTTSKTVIGQGYNLNITIKIINYGIDAETFNLTAYANTTNIQTITNVVLTSRNSTTLTFNWNTTGVAKGNYTISANASIVLGETDLDDNTITDGWVVVTRIGDVNGDGSTDVIDILLCCVNMGPVPPMPPECDVNGDGNVNVIDILLCCTNME